MDDGPRRSYLKAIGLMVLGFSLVPGMDAIAKYLRGDYSVFQLGWARFVFHLMFVLLIVWWRHRKDIWPRMPRLQLALGYFVFGDFPDAWTFVGIGIIIAAGVLVFYRAPSEAM